MQIRLVWWSYCLCVFGGQSFSSILSHLVPVGRTLSRLAKLKLDLSAFLLLCGFSCCVSPCSAAPLPEPELQWAECSAEGFCKGWDLNYIWAQRDPSVALCIHTSKCCATGTSLTSTVLISVVFVSKRGKVTWYWKVDSTGVSSLYWQIHKF